MMNNNILQFKFNIDESGGREMKESKWENEMRKKKR